ncbi:E3 ubiquitin-protein ligase RSL1-like [Bidens hawaiensis]|uniref:E3 ubiquitin-protein ligase RSL1-like n=1 Tax=Bidens hawaiensis TaxID=980011 RepID=UPI004049137A
MRNQIHQDEEETFTCDICIKPVTLTDKFINNDKCVHPFCTDCMIKYIQVKLENNVSKIKCPATTCKHSLEPLSCRPKIPRKLFDKWCEVLCNSMVLGVNRVYCPNRECSELILNECGDGNLTRCMCPNCKKPFCYMCKGPWHVGSICEENMDENNVAFDVLYTTNNWRMCPKCGHCIEHIGGCNIIHCILVLRINCGFRPWFYPNMRF